MNRFGEIVLLSYIYRCAVFLFGFGGEGQSLWTRDGNRMDFRGNGGVLLWGEFVAEIYYIYRCGIFFYY